MVRKKRTPKEMEQTARDTLKMSKGLMPITIVAYSQEEYDWFTDFLKGKKHNAVVDVRLEEKE